eukprot:TRINITY_DN287_c0_g2_i5.p1 TRINITY_DN287_c0_g2~~TRINITY_DN287_c0_g2_i5.p1  ORF type:complete len:224 (+),score=74.04 TRINITY_DN287_c0_g2_i5:107-778(+)
MGLKEMQAGVRAQLTETSEKMGDRAKVMEANIKECNKDLLTLKNTMKTQTGMAYKQSQRKAMMLIKKKKLYETQYNNLTNMQFNIDTVQITTEGINDAIGAANCLKQTVAIQKAAMQHINIDELDDLQEEMQDLMQDQEEIQEILGRDYSLDAFNEAELEQELDELDEEIVAEKLQDAPSSKLPSQPQKGEAERIGLSELNAIMNNCDLILQKDFINLNACVR